MSKCMDRKRNTGSRISLEEYAQLQGKEDTNLTTKKGFVKGSMENQDLKHHRKRWDEAIQGGEEYISNATKR